MKPDTISELRQLFLEKGQHVYGENVTVLQHSVQSGELAEQAGFDDEIVVAAFLHDVGHFFDNNENMAVKREDGTTEVLGTLSHDKIGADFLRENGFSEKIAALVEGHVQAKRYLTFKDPEYDRQLSDASRQTLAFQGGKMTPEEATAFEQNPLFDLSIQMRKWDEAAKDADKHASEKLEHFLSLAAKQLQN